MMNMEEPANLATVHVHTADGSWRPVNAVPVPGHENVFRLDPEGRLDRDNALASNPDVDGPAPSDFGSGDIVKVSKVDGRFRAIELFDPATD
jgi:hypothetical protein